jgi:hypothetical protein
MTDRSETSIQTIERVRASIRRAQAKARKAAKVASLWAFPSRIIADDNSAKTNGDARLCEAAERIPAIEPTNGEPE